MYKRPAVPERIIPLSRSIKLNPFGPTTAPAMIRPSKAGIFILFKRMGVKRIMTSIYRNFSTGLVKGRVVSMMVNAII